MTKQTGNMQKKNKKRRLKTKNRKRSSIVSRGVHADRLASYEVVYENEDYTRWRDISTEKINSDLYISIYLNRCRYTLSACILNRYLHQKKHRSRRISICLLSPSIDTPIPSYPAVSLYSTYPHIYICIYI